MNKEIAIEIKNLSKMYNLSQVGTGTISQDLNRFFAKLRGKPDPYATLAELNDRTVKGTSNNVWALQNIDLTVERGEVLGIIGRNGAGKSTLLKILSGITAPTTGNIQYNGRMASLLEVGTGMHPEMTARENVFLNGAIMGMTRGEIAKKLDDIIEFAGVVKYIDTPIKRFSSGMKVRLGFAVAAFLEPEILVVDEVLAVGDAEFQKRAVGKMQEVSKGGERTVLFVSHNMAAVQNLCNKGVLMDRGKIKSYGSINEVIDNYMVFNFSDENNLINISELINRSGNQSVKLIDFYIENEKGKRLNSIMTGEDIYFVFKIKFFIDTDKVDLGFSIHNSLGDPISVMYSGYNQVFFSGFEGDSKIIKFKYSDFNINQKRISINARILNKSLEADWVRETLKTIDIEHGDFYKSGKNQEYNTPLLIRGTWI